MQTKEIKSMLYNYSKLLSKKRELEIKYQELEYQIGIGAVESSEGKSYSISKITERQAMKLAEQKEKIENFNLHKGIEINRVDNLLNALSDKEKKVIELIYFKRCRYETVAYTLNKSYRTVKRIEHDSFKVMRDILNT